MLRAVAGLTSRIHGFCRKHRRPGKFNDTCEEWADDGEWRERRRRVTLEELYIMAGLIGEIAEILKLEHYDEKDSSQIEEKITKTKKG